MISPKIVSRKESTKSNILAWFVPLNEFPFGFLGLKDLIPNVYRSIRDGWMDGWMDGLFISLNNTYISLCIHSFPKFITIWRLSKSKSRYLANWVLILLSSSTCLGSFFDDLVFSNAIYIYEKRETIN